MGSRQQNKRWEYLRETGRPSLLTHESPEVQWAISKLRSYNQRGMSLSAMADQVGMAQDAITRLLRDERPGTRRSTFEKIRRIEFDGLEGQRARVPLLGSQRRLRALRADGFPYTFLSVEVGYRAKSPQLQRIMIGEKQRGDPMSFLIARTARRVEQVYEKLAGVDPLDLGIAELGVKLAKGRAAKLGYAPSGCWDPDTIDDPEAIPDWTGRCGTPFGYILHRRESIPLCGPCQEAYTGNPYPGFSGELLRQLRERRGMSRPALAASLNLNPATIQYWETGRNLPTRQFKLDEALNVLDGTYEDVCEEA